MKSEKIDRTEKAETTDSTQTTGNTEKAEKAEKSHKTEKPLKPDKPETLQTRVLILMGSDSDLQVMKAATEVLAEFQVGFQVRILSAHRSPDMAMEAASQARELGFRVIICGAGMAAHLAGAVAAKTILPVIGVPLESGPLKGVDALYSTVMMPPGVPVATVAIGGARNAGVLALEILATADERIADELKRFKANLAKQVAAKDRKVQEELSR